MAYTIAGIDVHKRMLAVVVSDLAADAEDAFERRPFGSTPTQLRLDLSLGFGPAPAQPPVADGDPHEGPADAQPGPAPEPAGGPAGTGPPQAPRAWFRTCSA